MKKLLSTALALVLAFSLSNTAFAATNTNTTIGPDTEPKEGVATLNYNVSPAYTVTIPGTITLYDPTTGGNGTAVKASNVKLNYGEQVVVKLTGINQTDDNPQGDDTFTVNTAEGASLGYTVTNNSTGDSYGKGDAILTVKPEDGSGSTNLKCVLTASNSGDIKYAGNYSGTLTFTVSVESSESINGD